MGSLLDSRKPIFIHAKRKHQSLRHGDDHSWSDRHLSAPHNLWLLHAVLCFGFSRVGIYEMLLIVHI